MNSGRPADKTIPSGGDDSSGKDRNTPVTQRNKEKGALEFKMIEIETRVSTTVGKKDRKQESDDENVDMASSGVASSGGPKMKDTIAMPTV